MLCRFLPDLVTSLPYDAMPLLFPKNPSTSMFLVLRTLRVLKLGKMYRVLRVSRIFSRIETSMSIDYSTLQLIGYFVSSLLVRTSPAQPRLSSGLCRREVRSRRAWNEGARRMHRTTPPTHRLAG